MKNFIKSENLTSCKNLTNTKSGGILTIDLDALVENYHILTNQLNGTKPSAVVKADGYGLGAVPIALSLINVGCSIFFVANLEEGINLRDGLNESKIKEFTAIEIHILSGLIPNTENIYDAKNLIPVLGSIEEIYNWKTYCQKLNKALPCDIHVDTGMCRLGLPPKELAIIEKEPSRIEDLNINLVISHLACADEPNHEKNKEQLIAFNQARKTLPKGRASLANSSGIFLGPEYHFDLTRPGAALYGIEPIPGQTNPMKQVVRLQGRIAQIREVDTLQTVGYGGTYSVDRTAQIATVLVGYADGYFRYLSSKGIGYIENFPVPVVGRVSMDLITIDISNVPKKLCPIGGLVDLIGPNNTVNKIAKDAGTIGYEILTNLGNRFHRYYKKDNQPGNTS